MKVISSILAIVALVVALSAIYDMYAEPRLVPASVEEHVKPVSVNTVPDFSFTTINGKTLSIGDLKGKIVLVNFWATWCLPCLTEFPGMLDLINSYNGKVILLAISSDYKAEDIKRFTAMLSPKAKKILKSDSVLITLDSKRAITHDIFLTERYPETIIVSPEGKMVQKIVGAYDWNNADMRTDLESLLREPQH